MTLGGNAGMTDHGLQRSGQRYPLLFTVDEGRHEAIVIDVITGTAGDIVEIARIVVGDDDFLQLLQRHHVSCFVGVADRHADDEILAAGCANRVDDRQRQAAAILQRSTPAIVAPVRPRRPELVEQGVIGGEQIDAVEARRLAALCRAGKTFDDFENFAFAHGVTAVGIMVGGEPRGRPVRHERQIGVAMLADVVELLHNSGAVCMHGIGKLAKRGDDFVVAMAKVTARQYRGWVHRHRLDHYHRRAADSAFFVVSAMAFSR